MHGPGIDPKVKALKLHSTGSGNCENAPHFALDVGTGARRVVRGNGGLGRIHVRRCQRAGKVMVQLGQQIRVPVVLHRNRFHHRAGEFCGEPRNVNGEAARLGHVGHVQRHDDGVAQSLQFEYQTQIHAQVGGINHRDDCVHRRLTGTPPLDHLHRHLFVGCCRMKAIDAGQVDDGYRVATGQAHQTDLALYGYASVICDLLACTREQVE